MLICGRKLRRRPCFYCGRWTRHRCDWRMLKPYPIPVERLHPGMMVHGYVYYGDTDITLSGPILHIRHGYRRPDLSDASWAAFRGPERRRIYVRAEWRGPQARPKQKDLFPERIVLHHFLSDTLPILRPGRCSNACCDRCRRTVGPDVDYCLAHWNDQAGFLPRSGHGTYL